MGIGEVIAGSRAAVGRTSLHVCEYKHIKESTFSVERGAGWDHVHGMPKQDCTDILKALSDRSRMRIVKTLLTEAHSVNDLAEELEISQYNVSKHLRILREAGIVEVEPDGTRREYFIAAPFRKKLEKAGNTLDFGCCSFDFAKLAD